MVLLICILLDAFNGFAALPEAGDIQKQNETRRAGENLIISIIY